MYVPHPGYMDIYNIVYSIQLTNKCGKAHQYETTVSPVGVGLSMPQGAAVSWGRLARPSAGKFVWMVPCGQVSGGLWLSLLVLFLSFQHQCLGIAPLIHGHALACLHDMLCMLFSIKNWVPLMIEWFRQEQRQMPKQDTRNVLATEFVILHCARYCGESLVLCSMLVSAHVNQWWCGHHTVPNCLSLLTAWLSLQRVLLHQEVITNRIKQIAKLKNSLWQIALICMYTLSSRIHSKSYQSLEEYYQFIYICHERNRWLNQHQKVNHTMRHMIGDIQFLPECCSSNTANMLKSLCVYAPSPYSFWPGTILAELASSLQLPCTPSLQRNWMSSAHQWLRCWLWVMTTKCTSLTRIT